MTRIKSELFRLPKEHGALVALAISTFLSLALSISNWPISLFALVCLWLVILSMHNRKISFLIALVSGLFVSIKMAQLLPVVFLILVWSSYQLLESDCWGAKKRVVRESLGMAGAAIVPLAFAFLFSQRIDLILLVSLCLLASTFSAGYIVHSATNQINTTAKIMLLVSILAWSMILIFEPKLFLVASIPFNIQVLSLERLNGLSFKRLGMIEATSLSWVTVLLFIVAL